MDEETPAGKRPPTIKDVAALAGVSWRTVSNVVNGHKYLSEATREKVETAIATLGYRPQIAGRQLRSGRSNLLTLSVPFISHPYFAQLAHVVVLEAEKHHYDVVIDETRGDRERELRVASGYQKIRTDGILFSPLSISLTDLEVARDGTPLVLLGEQIRSDRIDRVLVDNVRSTRDATAHLVSIGRRRIGFLGAASEGLIGSADLRVGGYLEGLRDAGIEADAGLVIEISRSLDAAGTQGHYSREEGYERIRELLPTIDRFDGLVCGNDLLAFGALRALREAGIRVPEDIAVIGWDDVPDAAFSTPSLTTIAPDLAEIARLAIETLLSRIENPESETMTRIAPYALVVRGSTVSG